MAAVVNMNNLLNGKDSRWLQLEVCREFQRNKCSRPDTECKFAHPPANVEVQNGRVTACYDSIKGRCNREKPPCKYFHPPQHLKDQLLINGRNHLALKNALMQQMGIAPGQQGVLPGQVQTVDIPNGNTVSPVGFSLTFGTQPIMANPYLTGVPANTYNPYFTPAGHIMPTLLGPDPTVASQLGPVVPQAVPVAQQKIPRSDRLEVCREFMRGACKRAESECRFAHPQESVTTHEDGSVTVCMDAVKGRCARDPCRYFHPPLHLQAQIKAAQSRATASAQAAAAAVAALGSVVGGSSASSPSSSSSSSTSMLASVIANLNSIHGSVNQQTHPHHHHHQHHHHQLVANSANQQQSQQATTPQHQPPPNAATAAVALSQQLEIGKKRAAESDMFQLMDVKTVGSFYYDNFAYGMVPYKRPAADKSGIPVYQPNTTYQQLMQLQQPYVPVSSTNKRISQNAPYVIYTDVNGQLLDTLPVCQDFNKSQCNRPTCRFVHLMEDDHVEVIEERVALCRDHAIGICKRQKCKYYHIPIILPPAHVMAAIHQNLAGDPPSATEATFTTSCSSSSIESEQLFGAATTYSNSPKEQSTKTTNTISSSKSSPTKKNSAIHTSNSPVFVSVGD